MIDLALPLLLLMSLPVVQIVLKSFSDRGKVLGVIRFTIPFPEALSGGIENQLRLFCNQRLLAYHRGFRTAIPSSEMIHHSTAIAGVCVS
jgi:hypothetical protein